MEGYKVKYKAANGEELKHWDEASNISYDNTDVAI